MNLAGRQVVLPTTMVGSWPRPLWLRGAVFRDGVDDLDYVDAYQRTLYEDAVRLCVKDQDLAGLDIVTDGNQYFQGETPYDRSQILMVPLRLRGFRRYGPASDLPGLETYFRPIVHDRIRWQRPIFGPVLAAMKLATNGPFKLNINSGPAFVANWCEDQYYGDIQRLRSDIGDAFNAELRWLADHGAETIQLTEPSFLWSDGKDDWAIELMNRAAEGVDARLVWHMCYGHARDNEPLYPQVNAGCLVDILTGTMPLASDELQMETARTSLAEIELLAEWARLPDKYLGIGVIEGANPKIETEAVVAGRIRTALEFVPHDRLVVTTDCGLYGFPRATAFRKLQRLVQGTRIVRQELGRRGDGTM